MYSYSPLQTTESLEDTRRLLCDVFPHTNQFTSEYIDWMYRRNPLGPSLGYNAYSKDRVVAHVAAQPTSSMLFGEQQRGILIHNVATRPESQGKGIFSRLLRECLADATGQGFSYMVAVPNQNSTPGFTRSLKCQFVASLSARIVWELPSDRPKEPLDYERLRDEAQLLWRLSGPGRFYSRLANWVIGKTNIPGLRVMLGQQPGMLNSKKFIFPRLWVGLSPRLDWGRFSHWEIPMQYRPAPLNLVFLDLTGQSRKLDYRKVSFQALDFDIY